MNQILNLKTIFFSLSFFITAASSAHTIKNTPTKISIIGPSTIISENCSKAVILQTQDLNGTPSKVRHTTSILLKGLSSAEIYTNSSCQGAAVNKTIIFTPGTDTKRIYLKTTNYETLDIIGKDISSVLTSGVYKVISSSGIDTPQMISINGAAGVYTNTCSKKITIQTQNLNGAPSKVRHITSILLSGVGSAKIYTSSSCQGTAVSKTLVFTPGTDTRSIYLRSLSSEMLDIIATDVSSNLIPAAYDILISTK